MVCIEKEDEDNIEDWSNSIKQSTMAKYDLTIFCATKNILVFEI